MYRPLGGGTGPDFGALLFFLPLAFGPLVAEDDASLELSSQNSTSLGPAPYPRTTGG